MDKNSRVIWILALVIAIGVIYKLLHPKQLPVSVPLPVAVSPSPAPSDTPPLPTSTPQATATPTPAPSPMITDSEESPTEKNIVEFKIFQSPICMSIKSGVINLPSIFLRQFYSETKSWIALPKSYTQCLKNGAVFNAMFYEFDAPHQFPYRPLVKMNGFIAGLTEYPTLSLLKEANRKTDYKTRIGRRIRTDIYSSIETLFATKLSEPWVQVTIVRNNIEDTPSFWPGLPPVHPIAKIISKADLPKGMEWAQNYTILDVRHSFQKNKFTLPFPTKTNFNLRFSSDRKTILNSNRLKPEENKFIFKKGKNSAFMIIGNDAEDLTAYNAANFLALAGYKSITLIKEGAQGWGAPAAPDVSVGVPNISSANLHKLQKSGKKDLVILDCRGTRESSRSSIAGSINIPAKDVTPTEKTMKDPTTEDSEDEDGEKKELDIATVENKLKSMNIDTLVVYGRSGGDDRAKKRARYFIQKVHPNHALWLDNGYQGWQFFTAYHWVPENPKEKRTNENMLGKAKDLRKFYGTVKARPDKPTPSSSAKEQDKSKVEEGQMSEKRASEKEAAIEQRQSDSQESKREERKKRKEARKSGL